MPKILTIVGTVLILGAMAVLLLQNKPDTGEVTNLEETTLTSPQKTITQAVFSDQCSIDLTVSGKLVSLPSSFDPAIAKCDLYSVVVVSATGQYAAYEDLSSTGVDAKVVLYSAQLNRSFTLDDYGEQSVIDLAFLPNNRLLVLYSQGLSGIQTLRLYDIPNLESEITQLPGEEDLPQEILGQFVFERLLNQASRSAQAIRITNDAVVLVDEKDDLTNPVYNIALEEL